MRAPSPHRTPPSEFVYAIATFVAYYLRWSGSRSGTINLQERALRIPAGVYRLQEIGRSHSRAVIALSLGVLAASLALFADPAAKSFEFDTIIRNGRIVDGGGNPWYRADVGIRGKTIAAIGDLSRSVAKRVIDAHDHVVAPGFIEMMGEDSYALIDDSASAESKLQQGCTTLSVGEGDSEAPQNSFTASLFRGAYPNAKVTWQNYQQYFALLRSKGIALNLIHNVGAAQVREVVIGDTNRVPSPVELEKMKALVAEAMQQGANGLSSALIYPPGNYATTQELVALAKVAAQYHGIYLTHIRDESGRLLPAIDEALSIGEQAGIPVHIYHLKAAGAENWHLIEAAIQKIQAARARGIDVTADTYPYIYNGLNLGSFIPPAEYSKGRALFLKSLADPAVRQRLETVIKTRSDWENWYLHIGADWNNVLIEKVPQGMDERYEGRSLHQVALLQHKDDWTVFFDLVQNGDPVVSPRSMNEEQKRAIYQQPWASVSSDAGPANPATNPHVHPRTYGTFPRIFAKYVREDHVLTLEDAVRKMTSLPANILGIYDRGRIAIGLAADLVIFDPATIKDNATFAKPAVYPSGIDAVLVNGAIAVQNGKRTNATSGEILLHSNAGQKILR
jgi:N-acyl-D-aspartate/D-glutamate deacylase